MNRCTAAPILNKDKTSKGHFRAVRLGNMLLLADLVLAAALGYVEISSYSSQNHASGHVLLANRAELAVWSGLILISMIAAAVFKKTEGLLNQDRGRFSAGPTIPKVVYSTTCAGTLFAAAWVVTGAMEDLARLCSLFWIAVFITWMLFSRLLLLAYRRDFPARGGSKQAIAIIGARECLTRLATLLAEDARVTQIIDHSAISGHALAEGLASVIALARDGVIGLVVLATDDSGPPQTLSRIIECLKAAPVRVAVCNYPTHALAGSPGFLSVAGIPMSLIADRPLSRRDMLVKMVVDKLGALLLLVLALPLLLAIALAILLETGGPIIFQQRRNGWCGRLFTVLKFRTMRHAPGQHVLYQTQRVDPRCTRVGLLLRRTSLDELPQLWNVLRGDMSLVGPRPHADFMHARERASSGLDSDYAQRQRVKPGLTGWAQVHGLRGAIDTPEELSQRVEFDRYYIENWSIWLDLKILAKTPWAVLSRENAF